jgi:transposase
MISPGPDASVRPGSSRRCAARSTGAGGRRPSLRILRRLFTALADPTGVRANRPGALERVGFLLQDWQATADKLADTETRMTGVLDQLRLTDLATSIPGLSPVGATAILAETDDPTPFRHRPRPGQTCRPRATREAVRHLRRPHQTHRPRPPRAAPGRLAQPRVWGAQRAIPVYAARYRHLTTREQNRLTPTQAQTVTAAAILRHLHAVITTGHAWDPDIATHGTSPPRTSTHRRLTLRRSAPGWRRGEPSAALRHCDLDAHRGQPGRRLTNPITR